MVSGDVLLSVEEVNQRLPLVRSIVRDIVELHQDLEFRKSRLASIPGQRSGSSATDDVYGDEVQQMEAEIEADERQMKRFRDELRQIGGTLTDPSSGTVDFNCSLQGDVVSLCWRPPESQVMYWHSGECVDAERILLCPEVVTEPSDEAGLV